ncbi:MAG: hypothetical protein LBE36_13315 [Flavobacteriaceae bacterium]|jgi:hypothetical protein|nr:hypothetical protein [Flavobacteriaceae bacterium]
MENWIITPIVIIISIIGLGYFLNKVLSNILTELKTNNIKSNEIIRRLDASANSIEKIDKTLISNNEKILKAIGAVDDDFDLDDSTIMNILLQIHSTSLDGFDKIETALRETIDLEK